MHGNSQVGVHVQVHNHSISCQRSPCLCRHVLPFYRPSGNSHIQLVSLPLMGITPGGRLWYIEDLCTLAACTPTKLFVIGHVVPLKTTLVAMPNIFVTIPIRTSHLTSCKVLRRKRHFFPAKKMNFLID